ncbi:MAG: ABC transporter ATP-binding protein [Muribaculaceae bacterium]|nr:ABC transporter ATP-binding protein [Muribaculaceae bacterium]
MITLRDFTIGFGRRELLSHVDASFSDGCLTALLGRNGTGKSTMLRAIARLNTAYTGTVTIDGADTTTLSGIEMARRLAFVTTERTRIPGLTCADVVGMGRAPYTGWSGHLHPTDHTIVAEALRSTGMQDYAERYMQSMSDGECQRVMIARALAQDTANLLLDEPTSFLDMPNRYQLATLLRRLAHDRGKCIIFSTHELDIALHICDTIALVDNGRLHHLPARDMADSGLLQRLFAIEGLDFDPLRGFLKT